MGQAMAYLEAQLYAHVLGNTPYTAPTDLYVVLSTGVFDPTLDGTTVVEPTAIDYGRLHVVNNTTNFPAPSGSNPSSGSNGTAWNFPTATHDWGVILSAYLADDPTTGVGNLLFGTAAPGAGVSVLTGVPFTVGVGGFLVRVT